MVNSIIVDGIEYDMVVSVSRTAKVTPTEVSGMMLDRKYFNDVLGTYFEYQVKIAVPTGNELEYAALYEVLTNPVSEHTFILPYNQSSLTLKARVEVVNDQLYRKEGTTTVWRGITFNIIATEPTK